MTTERGSGEGHELDRVGSEARRMEVLGRLAAGVAHDFNNVLAAIRGYSQITLRSLDGIAAAWSAGEDASRAEGGAVLARMRADVAAIDESARRAAALTRQLAMLSRPAGADVAPLDLDAFASGLHVLARRLLPAHVEVAVALAPGPLPVLANEPALLQTCLQVVLDLCDTLDVQGRLELETFAAAGSPPRVTLAVRATASAALPVGARTRQLAAGLLALAGGELRQPEGSAGASIEISLPAADARPTEPSIGPADPHAAAEREGATVLVVEDDPAVRRIARTLLERLGYRVVPAADGDEALRLVEMLAADGVAPDLLVTDVRMPGMSGPALAAELRQRAPELGVLFMSGMGEPSLEDGVDSGGRDEFLEKPFTLDELAARVAGLLAAR